MSTITRTISQKVGSVSVSKTATETVNATPLFDSVVATSQPGSLTTRTSASEGEITATSSSHGISTGDIVDIYWTGGARYGLTVGTVDGTAIPITGGSGDDLPIAETAINTSNVVTFADTFDGDDVKGIAITSTQDVTVDFRTAAASALSVLVTASSPYQWFEGDSTNPIASDDITSIRCSNKSLSTAATIKISLGMDITS